MDYITIAVPVTAGLTAAGAVAYRILAPRYPVQVNCHFCRETTKVPYGNSNCWDCPHCEQYNGFAADGGYNKPIPAQYYEDMNYPIEPEQKREEQFNVQSNVLCDVCTKNQILKVKQLANYVPQNEANFDVEVDAYRYHLEQVYHLCRNCDRKVKQTLAKQDIALLQQFEESCLPSPVDSSLSDWEDSLNCSAHLACRLSAPWHVRLLRLTSLLCATSVLLATTCALLTHSEISVKPSEVLPRYMVNYLKSMYASATSLVFLGMITTLLAVYVCGKYRLTIADALCSFNWLAVIVLHSTFISKILMTSDKYLLQTCTCTICVVLCLWCVAVPRFEKQSKTIIKKKKRRYELGSSAVSSTSGSALPSVRSFPPPENREQASLATNTNTHDPFNKFETMKIGTPKKRPQSALSAFGGLGDEPRPSTSSDRGNLESLRAPRPLISPAKFVAYDSVSSYSVPVSSRLSHSSHPASLSSLTGQSNNLPPRSHISKISGQQANAALGVSSPRSHLLEDESDQDSQDSSSECPVGTTTCNQQKKPGTKRSIFVQFILGVSLGLNLTLLLYLFFDYQNTIDTIKAYIV